MTIGEAIGGLRAQINRYDDDSIFTDHLLYFHLKSAAIAVNQRGLNRYQATSAFDWVGYCIKLEADNLTDCSDCTDVGCEVLTYPYKLPSVINADNRDMIRVFTLDMKNIGLFQGSAYQASFDPVMSRELLYDLVNRRLVIYNGDTDALVPRYVWIEGIWQDITGWADLPTCDPSTGQQVEFCDDLLDQEFQIKVEYLFMAYSMVLNQLGLALQPETPLTNKNVPG